VLTAAYTDADGSEQNSELAFAVHGEGTKNVACVPQERGAKLFYVSTDYLFDGTATHRIEPDHLIAPLSVYGQSKAAGEKPFQENHQRLVHCAYFLAFWHLRDLLPGGVTAPKGKDS
jgi:dTDP-4-dehydrorhamnose reductase